MVVRPPDRRATAFTTVTLRTAVAAWCSDAASAQATYGHISDWDTSEVEDMSHLFGREWDGSAYVGRYCSTYDTFVRARRVGRVPSPNPSPAAMIAVVACHSDAMPARALSPSRRARAAAHFSLRSTNAA